jgi:hydroxylysine kinase
MCYEKGPIPSCMRFPSVTQSSDDSLSVPPPVIPESEAIALASRHFGLGGNVARLTSERDANFHLTTGQGEFVLKVSNPAEAPLVTNLQTRALLHIATVDPEIPVQRVLPSLEGRHEETIMGPDGQAMILRLFTYLPGLPLHKAERSAAQRRALGTALARLGLALRGLFHPAAGHELLWDIKHAARMRDLLQHIEDPARRALVERILDCFDAHVTPALPKLRAQIVHADFNPHNVLVAEGDHTRVAGILDLGDMVHTPLVNDLAIAASYQLAQVGDPLSEAGDLIGAYHAVTPLEEIEIDLLYDLIGARLATTAAITSWRAARYPENRDYILRNAPRAWAGLLAFAALPRCDAREKLRRICGI